MKKMLLALAVTFALSSMAFAQDAAQPVAAPQNPGAPTVPQATAAPINQLQQSVGVPAPADASVSQTAPQSSPEQDETARILALPNARDESVLFREASRQQARLTLMKLLSDVEKKRMDMERERMKFAEEQYESQQKIGGGSARPAGTTIGSMSPAAQPSSSPSGAQPQASAQSVEPAIEENISVRSIYSFDGQSYAELMVGSAKVIARPGTELINGDKVVTIDQGRVVVLRNGERKVLPLEGSASTSPQAIAPFAAPASQPRNLPPMPGQ